MRRHIILCSICWTVAAVFSSMMIRSAFVCDELHSMWSLATPVRAGLSGSDNFYMYNGRIGYQGHRATVVAPARPSSWWHETSTPIPASLASWFGGEFHRQGTATTIELPLVYALIFCVTFPFIWAHFRSRREQSRSGFEVCANRAAGTDAGNRTQTPNA